MLDPVAIRLGDIGLVLWNPERAAGRIHDRADLAGIVGLLVVASAVLGYWHAGLTLEMLTRGSTGAGGGEALSRIRMVSVVLSPAGLVVKIAAAAYLFWSLTVMATSVSYRRVLSALLHAEVPLLVGRGMNILVMQLRPAGEATPGFQLGLNVLFPHVDLASPLGLLLGRINPFMFWWGFFLYLWLEQATRLSAPARCGLVVAFWAMLTAIQVGVGWLGTGSG